MANKLADFVSSAIMIFIVCVLFYNFHTNRNDDLSLRNDYIAAIENKAESLNDIEAKFYESNMTECYREKGAKSVDDLISACHKYFVDSAKTVDETGNRISILKRLGVQEYGS